MQNTTDKISGIYKGVKLELFEAFFINNDSEIVTVFSCKFYKNFKSRVAVINKKFKFYYL